MEVQLIKPGEGKKNVVRGKVYEAGTEWFRVSELDETLGLNEQTRTYETRFPWGIATTVAGPGSVRIISATGKKQLHKAGTLEYDYHMAQLNFFEAQLNLLEDKVYINIEGWKDNAWDWLNWVIAGKPKLNKTKKKAVDLYLKYSSMTY